MIELVEIVAWNSCLALVVGALGWIVWRTTRRASLAHALYLLAAIKLVTPPVFLVDAAILPVTKPAASELVAAEPPLSFETAFVPAAPEPELEPMAAHAPPVRADLASEPGSEIDLSAVLALVWGIGALTVVVIALLRMRSLRRLLAHADDAPERARDIAREVASRLGLGRVPRICVVAARLSPSLCVLGRRPVVVLPSDLLRDFEDHEVSAVLTHELSHLANRDHLTRWLELIVAAVHWWNPIAVWLRRGIREVEEVRCDARAVAALEWHPRRYGRVILKTACALQARPVPFAAAGLGEVDCLKRRIQMMINGKLRHGLNWPIRCALLAGAGTLLPLGVNAQERSDDVRVEIKKDAGEIAELVKKLVAEIKAQDVHQKADKKKAETKKVDRILRGIDRDRGHGKHYALDTDELAKRIEKAVREAIEKALRGHGSAKEHAVPWVDLFDGKGVAKAIRDSVKDGIQVKVFGPNAKSFKLDDFDQVPEALKKALGKDSVVQFDFDQDFDFDFDIHGGKEIAKEVRDSIKKSIGKHVDVEVLAPLVESFEFESPKDVPERLRKALKEHEVDILDSQDLGEKIEKALRKSFGGRHKVNVRRSHDESDEKAESSKRKKTSAKTEELLEQLEELKAQIRDLERKLRR